MEGNVDPERFQHEVRFRVRYQETDRMGVVYHSNHLVYFEVGRTELMREKGIRYADLENEGLSLAVTEASARFLARVTYDDEIVVRTSLSLSGKTKLRFDYRVYRIEDGKAVSEGHTIHVFLGPEGNVLRVPDRVRKVIDVPSPGKSG